MKIKKLLFYIATILSFVLAVFFGFLSIPNLQQVNPDTTQALCTSSTPIDVRVENGCNARIIIWSDLIIFISFTAISFSLLALGVYILITKIKLSRSKKLLFYPATILFIVIAVIFGLASITNLQRVHPTAFQTVCVGSNLYPGGYCSPTLLWADLNLFIVFTAFSFSLLVLGVYILIKRKK